MAGALRVIHLYDDGASPALRIGELASYLAEVTGCPSIAVHGSFLLAHSTPADWPSLARRLAELRLLHPTSPRQPRPVAAAEVAAEHRRLARGDRGPHGTIYDGFALQTLLRELVPPGPCGLSLRAPRLVFTNRLVATWGEDLRYHLRTILLGLPAVISTSGLVEAPARPREYYLALQQLGPAARSDLVIARLKEQFRGRFLDHDDPRLTEVAKGYALQAIAYLLTGEAFCDHPDCRLFNAHWQEEMLRAQAPGRQEEFCDRHREWLASLRAEAAA